MRLAVVLIAAALLAISVASAAPARASEAYGELSRVSKLGKGTFEPTEQTPVFGFDSLNGGEYIGDEPSSAGVFRLQKLSEAGEALGEARFKAKCPEGEGKRCGEEAEDDIEGVVFDTVGSERRLYVLGGWERSEASAIDRFKLAAGALYAFSTTPTDKVLDPAGGTGPEGVLAGPATLKAAAEGLGEALLEPTGIAVDPLTHDVIVAGSVDEGEGAGDDEGRHLALQEITDTGALGARYVDPNRESRGVSTFHSPVVTQTGQILMESESSQVIQIPPSFSSTEAPTVVYELSYGDLEFGEGEYGGRLAIEPEGSDQGRLYAGAGVTLTGAGTPSAGILALHYETSGEQVRISEIGWMAGASVAAGDGCALGIQGSLGEPLIAAGRGDERKVLALESGIGATPVPAVVELGPGGNTEKCPKDEASEAQLSVEGLSVKTAQLGQETTLVSTLTNANVLSAEWEFGDGTQATVTTPQESEAAVTHTFVKGGEREVRATIHTDDLADPRLTATTKVYVEGEPARPPVVVTGVASSVKQTSAKVNATVNPEAQIVTSCRFEYGPTNAYGAEAPCEQAPGFGESPVPVSATLSGLGAKSVYHFRVVATSLGGTSYGSDEEFETLPEAPTVTGLSPNHGLVAGGISVTITGTGMAEASAVKFGSVNAMSFTIDSPTSITAVDPSHSAGTVNVTVTNAGGTSATSEANRFTYTEPVPPPTVTKLTPKNGPTAGGTPVTITGTNFVGVTAVKFGSTEAKGFKVNSATSITAESPPEAAGTVEVSVTTESGTSSPSSKDKFKFKAPKK
ncbi:MAG TPA: IPT/TIG domain-containing protein [Solirubrobacteraceae bacterium]|nr:IPT/TIG domain-containing protein [Solirubrobacteraceae bacterium]